MTDHDRTVSGRVHEAAVKGWRQWSEKLATITPKKRTSEEGVFTTVNIKRDDRSPEERMIDKIKKRMNELPGWYETNQEKVADLVLDELNRIGAVLEQQLPDADEPVEVWNIPLSVFNWLADNEHGFVHGSLQAWSSAQKFNESNATNLDDERKTKLRESFYSIAPPLLQEVLVQLVSDSSLRVSFGRKMVGPEVKYLVLKVELVA